MSDTNWPGSVDDFFRGDVFRDKEWQIRRYKEVLTEDWSKEIKDEAKRRLIALGVEINV